MFNEEEIIIGCKKYRYSAQKILYERYAPLMHGVCLRYVYNKNEVKDVLQEGFLKVFDKINNYKGVGSFEGWIKRIMINHTINYNYKNKKHHNHLNLNEIIEHEINNIIDSKSEDDKNVKYNFNEFKNNEMPIETIEDVGFTYTELLEVLNQVPEPFKTVFNLHCIEKIKHEEIAAILNIDTSTSRTRLMRARKIIKKLLYQIGVDRLSN